MNVANVGEEITHGCDLRTKEKQTVLSETSKPVTDSLKMVFRKWK